MILTVEQARSSIATSMTDDDLRRLLDAAEEAIDEAQGRLVQNENPAATERHRPHGPAIMLARRALSITSVTEGDTVVDPSAYELSASGSLVRRITGSWSSWGPVSVTYQPYGDVSERARVQLELVKLEIAFTPGIASQSIGPWSESYSSGKPYPEQRADILSSLSGAVGIW